MCGSPRLFTDRSSNRLGKRPEIACGTLFTSRCASWLVAACTLALTALPASAIAQDVSPMVHVLTPEEAASAFGRSPKEPSASVVQAESSSGVSLHLSDTDTANDAPLPVPAASPSDSESVDEIPLGESGIVDRILVDSMLNAAEAVADACEAQCSPYRPYDEFFYSGSGRWARTDWIIGSGNRMGVFSWPVTFEFPGKPDALTFRPGGAIHFISGPKQTDLPPQVYELSYRAAKTGHITDRWSYDASCRVGWFTDFEGSIRQGLRLPAHGVSYFRHNDCLQSVLGVDYLDRDDVRLLPVFGFLWTPTDDIRVEAVFPKPLFGVRVNGAWYHIAAEMDGSTFDIKRISGTKDVATYRDFRVYFAILDQTKSRAESFEIGYVFGRHLQYRSGTPAYDPYDSIVIRSVFSF